MSLGDFFPLFNENEASIRARLDADVNFGLETGDPRWVDTREGSFYYDITQPVVLELARLWDALSLEVPASAFVAFAWGEYLDYHAGVFSLTRKPATAAQGTVLFAGDEGTFVPTGTIVATEAAGGNDPIEFETTDEGTTSGFVAAVSGATTTPQTSGGTLAAADYWYYVTAYNEFGETDAPEALPTTTTTSASSVDIDWNAVAGADGYRVYRATEEDEEGVRIYDGTDTDFTDTGATGTVNGPPDVNTTSGVRLPVIASVEGSEGNVGAGAIVSLESPNEGIDYVTNEDATANGEETESDEALRLRILLEYAGSGSGNINDYKRWALAKPGVGRVYVEPVWNGPGTVHVVIMDASGGAVSSSLVDELQTDLDPIPGEGRGLAPVGINVTVSTPATIDLDIVATITFREGYSLDGGGGLIALRPQLEASVNSYIDSLTVGEDVVYQHVLAQFFAVNGVLSVASMTLNGGTSDIAISDDPPQIAQTDTITLS
jgi:uncharacterized phage protein gp47/JayE